MSQNSDNSNNDTIEVMVNPTSWGIFRSKIKEVPKSELKEVLDLHEKQVRNNLSYEKKQQEFENSKRLIINPIEYFSSSDESSSFLEAFLYTTKISFDVESKIMMERLLNLVKIHNKLSLRGIEFFKEKGKLPLKNIESTIFDGIVAFSKLMEYDLENPSQGKDSSLPLTKDNVDKMSNETKSVNSENDETESIVSTVSNDTVNTFRTNATNKSKRNRRKNEKDAKESLEKIHEGDEGSIVESVDPSLPEIDHEMVKMELFHILSCYPFLYFSLIDGVETSKIVKLYEQKYEIDGFFSEFNSVKISLLIQTEQIKDEYEMKKFINYLTRQSISEGKGNIKYNSNYSSNSKKIDEMSISELKDYAVSVGNINFIQGMEKKELINLCKTTFASKLYSEVEDEDDIKEYLNNPLIWVKKKTLYYQNKSFFGIPCKFIAMMNENWIHGQYELLGGHCTRYINV